MRNLYARIVLWLIRPALEAQRRLDPQITVDIVHDTVIKDMQNNGPISRAMQRR